MYYRNMKYNDFIEKARELPFFGTSLLIQLGDTKRNAHNQLIRWERQGLIWRLKRGLYTLPDHLRTHPLSPLLLANHLYSPSYISLDTALSLYELIPELVTTVTSVSTAKTAHFENPIGRFSYQSIKEHRFFGFEEVHDENENLIRRATPEKAFLDRIYFDRTWKPEVEYFEENLRLQNVSQLSTKRLKAFSERLTSKKISQALDLFFKWRQSA